MVGIETTTNLSAKKEMKLLYEIKKQTSGAGSKGTNIFILMKEFKLSRIFVGMTKQTETEPATIKWSVGDPETVMERMTDFLAKLIESEDIEIISFTSGGSIVMWVSCKTKKALQKLRSIIESGDLQIFLTIIFTLLSGSSEELKVNVKAYATDLKWAEDYFHEKG